MYMAQHLSALVYILQHVEVQFLPLEQHIMGAIKELLASPWGKNLKSIEKNSLVGGPGKRLAICNDSLFS